MDVSLLRFALICLMVVLGLGAIFIVVLPFVMLTSTISGAASTIAGSQKSDEAEPADTKIL